MIRGLQAAPLRRTAPRKAGRRRAAKPFYANAFKVIWKLYAGERTSRAEVEWPAVILARADRAQHISVAGPDSLEAMVALCRAGFDHVECARQATCACADEGSDVLLILGRQSAEALGAVVARTCRLLRDGGVLVVQVERPSNAAAIAGIVGAKGMRVDSMVLDLGAGRLISHALRRRGVGWRAVPVSPQRATNGE